jgi:hypothetical protein
MVEHTPQLAPTKESARLRVLFHVAWAVVAISGPALEVISPASTEPGDWVWPLGLMSFAPAGALILGLRPRNPIGRILAAVAVASGILFIGGWIVHALPGGQVGAVLEAILSPTVVVTFWGIIALLFLFPTGVLRQGWERWSFRAFTVFILGGVPVLMVFESGPMAMTGRPNPFGLNMPWITDAIQGGLIALPIGAVLGVASLIVRFRGSRGVERAQLTLFLAGSGLVLGLVALIALVPPGVDEGILGGVISVLVVLGFWALPGSIVAAVLRYRLYDIDRLVSRSVTYLIVVALLGLGYSGSVVALQALMPVEGALPVAASTLAIAWVSIPLVRTVQRIVDRRFFRSRYDAQEVVADFSRIVRSNVDLDELTGRLVHIVRATCEPGHVAVWLLPARGPSVALPSDADAPHLS